MYSDSKKIQLIEEVLRLENTGVLKKVEAIIRKSKKKPVKKNSPAREFLGKWTKKESEVIEKAIEQGCEQIHLDEWR